MAVRADDVDLRRDRLLVERFQSGDVAGFEDLYRRYYRRLFRFCLKRVGDPQEAEELTQEAFTRAYAAMPRFAGERRFYPWLSVIAARLCADMHRRRSRTEVQAEVDPGPVEGGQDQVFAAVDRELVTQALARLGPRHRDVLRLREEEGWTYQRIAAHFDVSIGAVEQLLWRARRALRREFEVVAGGDARLAAGVPVLGWLARRLHGLRARFDDVATFAAPALANTAVSLAIVAGSAATLPSHEADVAPPARPTTVDLAPVAAEPATPTASATPPDAPGIPAPVRPAPAATPVPEPAPVGDIGPATVYSNDGARAEGAEHPYQLEVGGFWVSADPAFYTDDLLDSGGAG